MRFEGLPAAIAVAKLDVIHEVSRYLAQEPGRRVVGRLPVEHPGLCIRQVKALAGPVSAPRSRGDAPPRVGPARSGLAYGERHRPPSRSRTQPGTRDPSRCVASSG